jgi:hypothetical protein
MRRCCGASRMAGGIYIEVRGSPYGRPLKDFWLDPPLLIPDGVTVPARGVSIFEINGVHHVFDRVGVVDYPNVMDFQEECREALRRGEPTLSRRIQGAADFSKLTCHSQIFLIHERAWVNNFTEYFEAGTWVCPKRSLSHPPLGSLGEMCSGVWREDVALGIGEPSGRAVARHLPSCSYGARRRPDGVVPVYQRAVFGVFPISNLAVVNGGNADEALARAEKSSINVEVVDE